MSGENETDSLQFLPMERWEELEEAFKADWPRGISGYSALRSQRELSLRGLGYGFKVYCPYGDVSSGMVALNKKGALNEIIIQCPVDDTSKLVKAVLSSNIVDWKDQILIPCMPDHIIKCVRIIGQQLNLKVEAEDTESNELFILSRNKALFPCLSSNHDLIVKLLSKEHIEMVDCTWRNRYDGAFWFFEMLSKAKLAYGLFKRDELVLWVFINEVGALTHLFTVENIRNKGYAEILLQYVCNDKFNEVIIHSPTLDTSKLENALVSTKIIDWSESVIVPCLPPHTYECVERAALRRALKISDKQSHTPHDLVLFDQHKPVFKNVCLPEDITFQPLSEEHVDTVDAVWPNRYDSSTWLFKLLIKNHSSYGLFKNKELVTWVFVNEIGALVHLYTLEDHRKMGYGKLIMQLVCNKHLEEKKPVFGYCKRGNVSALKLYESLGFEQFHHVHWTILKQK